MDPALAHTIASDGGRDGDHGAPTLPRGTVLGRYIVVEALGRGAMGVVYKAYDPELDRKVALKLLIATQTGAEDERARIVREAKAMARLSHPNVVAVYDVGVRDEQVFIAMELVEGQPLRDWLLAPRSWREILDTFIQAGRGLSAAHAAGIVHRDFKPDNAVVGADGRVRVLDFGLAHAPHDTSAPSSAAPDPKPSALAVSVELSDARVGSLVGTPRYMPTEQMMGQPVTAAADQFAFCVSLWEALYGQLPYAGTDLLTLISNLRERRIVDAPSRGVPRWIRPVLVRGLSPDPAERHPSIDALLAALEHDPAIVRRRWLIGSIAVLAGAGVVAVAARRASVTPPPLCPSAAPELEAVWGDTKKAQVAASFRATGKPFADDAFRGASRALDAYGAQWVAMHGEACEASRVRGDQSSELMDLRMACLGHRLGAMRALVDQLAVADAKSVEGAIQAATSLPPIADCADVAALRAPVAPPADPAVRARIEGIRSDLARAVALQQTGRYGDARDVAAAAVDAANGIGYAPLQAEALQAQGTVLLARQEYAPARAALEDAVLAAVTGRQESVEVAAWIELVRAYALDRSFDRARDAVRLARAGLARDPDDARMATLLRNDGFASWRAGKLAAARTTLEQSLELSERVLPPDHPDVAIVLLYLGNVLNNQGDYDAALAVTRRALAVRERIFGPSHPAVASTLQTIGNALLSEGDPAGAETAYQRAVDIRVAAFGMENVGTVEVMEAVGNARLHRGDLQGALSALKQALELMESFLPVDDEELANKLVNLADAYVALKRGDDALPLYERALRIAEASYGATSWLLAYPLEGIGRAWLAKGAPAKAIPPLERALVVVASPDADPELAAETRCTMALALAASHEAPERARALAAQAREALAQHSSANAARLTALDAAFPNAR